MGQQGIPTGDGAPPALPATMRAAHADSYGPPEALRIVKADLPRMGDRDVLIRVHAAAVCRADTLLLAGRPHMVRLTHGIRRPRHPVPGKSVSGVVAAVGAAVTTLRIGDPVFGEIPSGGFADFAAARAELLAPKPDALDHAEAAALALSGVTALQSLRSGGLRAGERLLIIGASGSVGTLAVQIAALQGAIVTAVGREDAAGLLRALGATELVDPAAADFTGGGPRFDLILDLLATRGPRDLGRCLAPGGRCIAVAIPPGQNGAGPLLWLARIALADRISAHRFRQVLARPACADLHALAHLAQDHGLRPVIQRRMALDEIATAFSHVANGPSRGATVIMLLPADFHDPFFKDDFDAPSFPISPP